MATTYFDLLSAVESYYGAGSDQWVKIAQYGLTEETIPILKQVPGVSINYSNSGKILGYDYSNPFKAATDPVSLIDSNVGGGSYGAGAFNAEVPGSVVTNPTTGVSTMESGAKVVSTGSTLATIADRASLALIGVSLGTKLGKFIDSTIYNLDPDWWDENYPSINPETWDDIATTTLGKNIIRTVFGLQNDDATMYVDERMLAYTYLMLLNAGAWSDGEKELIIDDPEVTKDNVTYTLLHDPLYCPPRFIAKNNNEASATIHQATGDYEICFCMKINGGFYWTFLSRSPFTLTTSLNDTAARPSTIQAISLVPFIDGYPLYHASQITYQSNFRNQDIESQLTFSGTVANSSQVIAYFISPSNQYAFYHILLYQSEIDETPPLQGVTPNQNAGFQIDPNSVTNQTTGQKITPEDSIEDALAALKNQYPDLFDGSIYIDVMQEDGTIVRITYTPTPYPDTSSPTQPTTDDTPGVDPQTDPQIDPDTRPETQLDGFVRGITSDPTPPTTGGGSTPPYVTPTGSANALYSVYNPSQAELNSFGSWLWSSNFVDQLLKLFNDPMQAIIGLHKVFAAPPISGTGTIKVGYLDSGVSSNLVGGQYVTVNCGSVSVPEFFGNVFDYDPFTQVYLYLPFIGIERLDVGDVMRSTITVVYHVDVITGACLAEVEVIRDSAGGVLYTYSGNCAVQYPVSSGSYMGIVASLASIAGGVVGTIATGGALAPVAMGAVSGILNAHTRVEHSGGFSGNSGAMGIKKPYLIITRPQTALAEDFNEYEGKPANKTVTLSDCSGFTQCKVCHIENVPATREELAEIESLLLSGIII